MKAQLKSLFSAIIKGSADGSITPLARIALAVIHCRPELNAENISLSSFSVMLSEYHGRGQIPVVLFPCTTDKTDNKNSITSAIEDFIITESMLDLNVAQALRYIADEIIDNITEHADTPNGFICASWDANQVIVCIADAGKTIYGSYMDNQFDIINSDQLALRAAVKGISSKNRPGAENRGFGISTSSDMIVRGLGSSLLIFSGKGLTLLSDKINDYTELPKSIFMPGSLICFSLPIHKSGFSIYNHIGG